MIKDLNKKMLNNIVGGEVCVCMRRDMTTFEGSMPDASCKAFCCGGNRGVIAFLENDSQFYYCDDFVAQNMGFKGTVNLYSSFISSLLYI